MMIRKSGDLPVYRSERALIFHRPRVIGRKPLYNENKSLWEAADFLKGLFAVFMMFTFFQDLII